MSEHNDYYYLPEPSRWPLIGSIALFCIMLGFANWLHGHSIGPVLFIGGWVIMLYMMHGWFGQVIKESCSGAFNRLADHSFRWGMAWFIFSEVMFFSAFFFALFYARLRGGCVWLKEQISTSEWQRFFCAPRYQHWQTSVLSPLIDFEGDNTF